MAENKKSVLLYCDIIHTVKELNDQEAGKLFKHYLNYINDLDPEPPDKLTQIVFEPIKQNLKRDLKKWESKSERNSNIAKAGWIKRKDANECERIKVDAFDAVKGKVTVKVKDKVTVKVKDINIKDIIVYFLENGYSETAAKKFYDYYSIANWQDSKGNKVKNWKQKAQAVWFKPENKIIDTNSPLKMVY